MFRKSWLLATIAIFATCSAAPAIWEVYDEGSWPKSWPKELEPLRKVSGTIQGSEANLIIHRIPFTKREEFEAAWPHLLAVKTKGAPLILVRSPSTHWHFGNTKAGVLVHCPPPGTESKEPAEPIGGQENIVLRWMHATYIELVVDGEVVDLNRIPLPADTPIIDRRFEEKK